MKFAQSSLITHSGDLSKAHMDYLQGLQDAINKQDPKVMESGKRVNLAVNTLLADLHASGIARRP